MRLSFNWLTDYIDTSELTPELVAEKLTMGAFEVESVHLFGADLTGPIVVGEIVDIQAHPDPKVNQMRLTKVKVDDKQDPLEIVCGASNIAIGQRVPVALPGAIVINRHDGKPFPIAVVEKRGVRSNGMICAASELGITYGTQEDGILTLDPNLANKLGSGIVDLLCLNKDYVLTVASRSNRGDAVSIRGMAREVAALFQQPFCEPHWQLQEPPDGGKNIFTVQIDNPKDCQYFCIRALSDIKVAPSPPFIARRLAAVGARSINNLVDITNYVMYEWGQPLHAYDARYVDKGIFQVRRGRPGEKFTTLDGKERILTDEMLIIADSEKVIGSPVMGGANSEINETTTDIALEAASFNPAQVRRTGRLLGLSSESALRFERGVDSTTTKQASDRAAYLITKYCGVNKEVKVGSLAAGGKNERPATCVDLGLSEIKRHLNLDLSAQEVTNLLERLNFKSIDSVTTKQSATTSKQADKSSADKLVFAVPSYRQSDVHREIDLIEEVCRLYGYDNIKEETPSFFALPQMPENICASIRQSLAAQGLCEAYVSSLIPGHDGTASTPTADNLPDTNNRYYFADFDFARAIQMLNPLSKEHQILRQSLMPGLLYALTYNYDRYEKNAWLFELGFAYLKHKANDQTETNRQGVETTSYPVLEELKVSGILSGNRQLGFWHDQSTKDAFAASQLDFFAAKGVLENLFASLNISDTKLKYKANEKAPSLMHPGQAAQITYIDTQHHPIAIGWLGQLHPACAKTLDLDANVYLFELDVELLKKIQNKSSFVPLPSLPPVSRDLTVDLPKEIQNDAVVNCIRTAANHLSNLDLVSIYPLSDEKQSFSYRLIFQREDETFKGDEIERIMNNIRKQLKEQLSASFRG